MPSGGKVSGGWRRRNARTSSAKAVSSAENPRCMVTNVSISVRSLSSAAAWARVLDAGRGHRVACAETSTLDTQRRLGMGQLDGKVAIVTGSGRGIGREVALRLVRDGASV